jgi:hypothetical protein
LAKEHVGGVQSPMVRILNWSGVLKFQREASEDAGGTGEGFLLGLRVYMMLVRTNVRGRPWGTEGPGWVRVVGWRSPCRSWMVPGAETRG